MTVIPSAIRNVPWRFGSACFSSSATSRAMPLRSTVSRRGSCAGGAGEFEQGVDEPVHSPGAVIGFLEVSLALLVEELAACILDELAVTVDGRQRLAQIVGHRIAERLQFPVGLLQLGRPRRQFGVQPLDLLLCLLFEGYVFHQAEHVAVTVKFDVIRGKEADKSLAALSPEPDFDVSSPIPFLSAVCSTAVTFGHILPEVQLQCRPADHFVAPVTQ